MLPQEEKKTRFCPTCKKDRPATVFYKHHDECRSCVKSNSVTQTLEQKVEHRRQEKMLREELKKIAKQRLLNKKHQKMARKRAAAVKLDVVEEGAKLETDAATRELARRELQRRKLIEFVKGFHPNYKAGWVHHDICTRLEKFSKDVEEGKSPRLMLLVPPRHGKSQIASKMFPAWHLGHNPLHEFICCSYGEALALDFSRDCRDLVRTTQFGRIFPATKLNPEFMAAGSWRIQSPSGFGGGGYNAAGVGGPITGKGAHILIIDDPIKNAEEADSVDIRNKHWDWYRSTAYSRLAPGGGVLVIQTCWHYDDLQGRLQQEMQDNPDDPDVDQFEIIRYPAIAEEDEEYRAKGEPLHPDRYGITQLNKIKRTLGLRFWAALYQQSPIIEEGAYFNKDMFRYRDKPLTRETIDRCNQYIAWDFAISEKQTNDWTVGTVIAQDWDDNLHVVKQVRFKTNSTDKIIDEILQLAKEFPKAMFGAEDGMIWRTLRSALEKRMQETRIYISISEENILKPIRDKMVRARPLQARMQLGKVTFPKGAVWVDDLMREALRFPAGAHDDTIDSLAWTVQMAVNKTPPVRPKPATFGKGRELTVAEQLKRYQMGYNSVGKGKTHMGA